MIKKANIKKSYNLTMKFDSINKSKLHLDIQNIFKKWYNRKIKVINFKNLCRKKNTNVFKQYKVLIYKKKELNI